MGPESIFAELEEKNRIYLDIETDFSGKICVIGMAKDKKEFVQLVGEDVILQNVERTLCCGEVIVTFNGDRFDLPIIKKQLKLDLKMSHTSLDLCKVKNKLGIEGGLKDLERLFGIKRKTSQLTGYDVPRLWERYRRFGDRFALQLLLEYNREDVLNLIELEDCLRSILR